MFRLHKGIKGIRVTLLSYPSEQEIIAAARALDGHLGYAGEQKWDIDCAYDRMMEELNRPSFAATNFESLVFRFAIEGVSRVDTHQIVRTRIGASFSQESMRMVKSNGHFTIPETVLGKRAEGTGRNFGVMYAWACKNAYSLYESMIEAGVPEQDARFILPEGVNTSIQVAYSLPALFGVMRRRLCKAVQWGIHYAALEMKRCIMDKALFIDSGHSEKFADIMYKIGDLFNPPCITNIPGGKTRVCKQDCNLFPPCHINIKDEPELPKKSKFSNNVNANLFRKENTNE